MSIDTLPAAPPNALSLFFPTDQPTPTTFAHLLSLPPLLEPISPALAALHLARIRLVLSIPPGVIDQTAWCPICGGIRDALPSPAAGVKGKRKSGTSPTKRKRRAAGGAKIKWAKQCGKCGSEYRKPKPDFEARAFPSARAVRAVRTKGKRADGPGDNDEPVQAMEVDQLSPPVMTTMPLPSTNTLAPTYQRPIQPPPPPPKYVHNHGLIHVHTSSPHPPTYQQPPPVKTASPPPKEKGKKRKKSGLARLLAENKEREMGSGSAGGGSSWGLD